MYYFEIIETIKTSKDPVSAMDIYLELSKSKPVNMLNIKRQLTKLYLKNKNIDRIFIKVSGKPNGIIECRYFWID
jgi:hypothetical protein